MAIQFDEIDDYYTIADAAELTLQDGPWCVGIWTYVSDNAGTLFQYLLGNNNAGANNSLNLYLIEDAEPGVNNGKWYLYIVDGDGTDPGRVASATAPGGDSKWRLIICQRDAIANEIQIWFCEPGQAAVKEGSVADTNFNAVNGGLWNVGRRTDGNASRYYGGIAAEFFKGDFSLSQTQIEALGGGLPIKALAKQASLTLDAYLPMWEANTTLLDYSSSGNNGSRQDAPTTVTHAPVMTPIKRRRMQC